MKKKTNISDKALKLIAQNNIKPIPKWEFVMKNWGLWVGIMVSIGLLILGVSESWFGLVDNIVVPHWWIMIAIISLGISFILFYKTKKAYRFGRNPVLLVIALMGIVAGGIMFKTGMANRIDKKFGAKSNYYRMMVPIKNQAWSNPKLGYLSGTILKITNNNDFEIRDFENNIWKIMGNNPLIRGRVSMQVGEEINLIGIQVDDNRFKAEEIRPWNGMGQNMMKESD